MTNPINNIRDLTTFPLTREQEGLWVEWKLSPLGISYNTCIQMMLSGPVDISRFSQAITDVVAHFEMLRAYCIEQDGHPLFRLADQPYALEVIDLCDGHTYEGTSESSSESEAQRNQALALLAERRDAAIDLTQFPLIRAALVSTSRQTHYFIGVVPHIISDGYSAVLILKAISIAYQNGSQGLLAAFGADSKDWLDYLDRKAEQPAAAHANASAHWLEVLRDAQHITPICTSSDHSRHAAGALDAEGCRHFLSLDAAMARRFGQLARSRKTSLFSILAALYAVLLFRHTGQDNLVVVYPVNLRPAGFRDTFGCFVNMMPLRLDLSGNPTFTELVDRIGERRRLDKRHRHLPGLDIVKAKRQSTPGFDGRLCNVSMAQTVSRFEGLELPGITSTALDNQQIHVRDDLSLMYEVTEDVIGLWLEYRRSAFRDTQIERMAFHLKTIAAKVDEDPDIHIGHIELMDAEERARVLALGTGPAQPVHARSFGELFARTVQAHPGQTALQFNNARVSYADLDAASAALAKRFHHDTKLVAILLPRSLEQVIAIVAALRAGIAYVPLDTELPAARVESILSEVAPSALISDVQRVRGLSPRWQQLHQTVDPNERAADNLLSRVAHDAPAYIIYTSGSTGRPKGVQVAQRALVLRLAWLAQQFPLAPGEPVLNNTSYAFDVSVAEILWPLTQGATLVLSDPHFSRDARYLGRLIDEAQITTACFVASALQALLPKKLAKIDQSDRLKSLQRVLCAGEAVTESLVHQFYQTTRATLYNIYGPTEATIYATCKEVGPTDVVITIGKPIANTTIAIVNEELRLQPPGIEGELCIGGPGLADGYLAQDALTHARFPQGLFGDSRWYRTGDRVRLDDNGEVEYLGRTDDQVKLRGYRIELGEIEHALKVIDGVADAGVVMRDHAVTNRPQLVAYVAFDPGIHTPLDHHHPLQESRWRTTLKTTLPGYMIPGRLIQLVEVPRLASGKLDRHRLPADTESPEQTVMMPATHDELALATVWADVLGLPESEVGIHNDFFAMGGDSLMLVALASKAEARGLYFDIHELFEHSTIAQALPFARRSPRQLISQAPVEGTYATLPRHRKLFADGLIHPHHWNRCFVLRFNEHLNSDALALSLREVVRHHDGLRLSFHPRDGDHVFINHPVQEVVPELLVHSLTGLPHDQRDPWLIQMLNEANASLRLDCPPLMRALKFDDERSSTLALVIHHLLIDMRSCQILLEDLLVGYQAAIANRPIRLPAKTTSVAEWSDHLTRLVDSQWQRSEIPFWTAQLAHASQALPCDHADSRPCVEADQQTLVVELTELQTEMLTRALPTQLGMGVHQLLLAGFAQVFREWSGAQSLVVNTCGVGRDEWIDGVSLTRTVGELNTVFPLQVDLASADPLQAVKRSFAALPANGLHYGMLRYIARHPELHNSPEPGIFFNYVSRLDSPLEAALGVTVEMAPEGVMSTAPQNRACYELYLEALVQRGCLSLHMGFNKHRFDEPTIRGLLDGWANAMAGYLNLLPVLAQSASEQSLADW